MQRIFLIGYMGAGKSTLGRYLAKDLGMEFIDLDHYIEARFQKTVSQIFEELGEQKFREIEKNMLHEVGEFENVVIATGGGAPCFFDNVDYMNKSGITVYLKASLKTLTYRLNSFKIKRPLIKDKSESELIFFVKENMNLREKYYKQAKIYFDTDNLLNADLIDEFAEKLLSKLKIDKDKNNG